ncbi:MAG: porin, partial [Vicinamibacterales bacterium]
TGVEVCGDLASGVLQYAGMIGNGTADGQLSELDTNDSKDLIGRLMVRPWARDPKSTMATFAAGVATSTGLQAGPVPSFVSPARQTFFSYAPGAAGVDRRTRWSPQAYYYHGPFWGYAEYVHSRGGIQRDAARAEIDHDAWQIAGSWVVTGEPAVERNVRPRINFDPPSGHWGALQLVARYQQLHVSRKAFDLGLAAPSASRGASSIVVGANWYLNPLVKWNLNFERTVFDADGAVVQRDPENAILFQAQFSL